MAENRNIKDYLDALVDKDGIKTDVTVTLTDDMLMKLILALLASGFTLIIIGNLLKNTFPNRQLRDLQKQVSNIYEHLNSN